MIEVLFIALVVASLNQLINYAIGKPASEFSPYEIFSSYTIWLSIKRLKKVGLYYQYTEQYEDNIKRAKTLHEVISLKNDFKKMLYNAADPYFTWERAFGMCPVCTGFWVSLIAGLVSWFGLCLFSKYSIYENVLYLVSITVISHIIIRITNKLL